MSRPVIFLDVDGVLNNEAIFRYYHEAKVSGYPELDLCCVGRLLMLRRKADAEIVLSSTWRLRPEARAKLLGAGVPLDGFTRRSVAGEVRGHEIADWLIEHGTRPYVILDDDSDMLPGQPFVHVDWRIGLTDDDCAKALVLLREQAPAPLPADGGGEKDGER